MKETLARITETGKDFLARARGNASRVYLPALILLTGLSSFGLGRLSALSSAENGLRIRGEESLATAKVSVMEGEEMRQKENASLRETGGAYVASKSGKKYHFPWCSGAQRISAANKVWFESLEAARAAGYTPAENCKGLK